MTSDGGSKSLWRRRIIGRPPIWQGVAWTILGLVWIGITVFDPGHAWRYVLGGVYVLLGAFTLIVAVSDYRQGRGRYTRR